MVPKKSKEEVGSPGVVKKEGRKKVAGQKMGSSYGRTAATASRAVRGRELALLCFASLSPSPLPSLPLSPIGENVFRVESRCADVLPFLPPRGETQFTPLKSIVLRGTPQRGSKKVFCLLRGRKGSRIESNRCLDPFSREDAIHPRQAYLGVKPLSLHDALWLDWTQFQKRPHAPTCYECIHLCKCRSFGPFLLSISSFRGWTVPLFSVSLTHFDLSRPRPLQPPPRD